MIFYVLRGWDGQKFKVEWGCNDCAPGLPNREFKMLRRQRDRYYQNKIIHTNGSKENLLFIINRMILI